MIPGAIALIQDGLDDPALDLAMLDELELEHARRTAVESLETFGDALAAMRERAGNHFAIGRELFDRKLHTAHMISDNADELMRFGERLRVSAIAELEQLARGDRSECALEGDRGAAACGHSESRGRARGVSRGNGCGAALHDLARI